MRVFIYEAITAGAGCAQGADLAAREGLLAEGLAMLRAVTDDFAALEEVEVWGLRDARLADFRLPRQEAVIRSAEEERAEFVRLADACDWTLIIAPELDGWLSERVQWHSETRSRLISPSGDFLVIASSKRRTAERLHEQGIPSPASPVKPSEFPVVLKRDDGAGSVGMRLLRSREELDAAYASILPAAASAPRREVKNYRLENYCPGLPVSLALLCGPAGNVALQPCEQHLSPETFEYLGGSTPLAANLASRAKTLALAAIAAMPVTSGYVGVDLVLGEEPDGSRDVVIEINPRLTTSYVGLRRACQQNLAQAMLDVACGRLVDLSFREERVEFRADGSSIM
jgi:predicted ATP-grasp superfamily ATP-dependent carboligase